MGSPPELVDNRDRFEHGDALRWLADNREATLSVATGYVRMGGLTLVASLPGGDDRPVRLLLGAMPEPGLGAFPQGPQEPRLAGELFRETLSRLRQERDFESFPEERRRILEEVRRFISSERVQVRRFTTRFLHGKAYLFADRGDGGLAGEGAILVSSANLTAGGLYHNLELGAVRYDPSAVVSGLDWFDELWNEADDFKEDLLGLLFPPEETYDPQTIFRRALIELYGDQLEQETRGETQVGGLTLTRFQEEGYRRARRILEEVGGVVYADGVGTGKTEIGLRVVEEYAKELGRYALIVVPAQLRESLWDRRRVEHLLPCEVVSYQDLAADEQLGGSRRVLRLDKDAYRLVVIDEAHAFRNADNTWYAALDRLLGGSRKDLVLLTATPVNNTLWDLFNLTMLFARHDAAFRHHRIGVPSLKQLFLEAGARDLHHVREEKLFPLVDAVAVRRDRTFIQERYQGETFPDGTPVRFPTPLLQEVRYDLDDVYPGVFKEVVDGIDSLTMARYLPARYVEGEPGEVAREEALAGLMKSQLLKRFESSGSAARETLGRMVLAHEALVTAWERSEMVPSLSTIKDVVKTAQEGDPLPDLVDAALDEDVDARPASDFDPAFLDDVRSDLEVLRDLSGKLERLAVLPDPKLDRLAEILAGTDAKKVAVFASFADTARYVAEALALDPDRFGDRAMTVVIGTETEAETRVRELERFCPESVTGDPAFTPPDGEVDLLLSTDVLSEGQNLQQAQAVVSYDMPWNPQRVVQRNGRVIRLRSPHDRVYLFTMLPKQGDLEEALKLEARIRGKIAAANATFGMESPVLADVEAATRVFNDDLKEFFDRVAGGDPTLLEEGQGPGSGSFVGEEYRWILSRLLQEGEFAGLRRLPWGIGSAFTNPSLPPQAAGVFFACRTKRGDRLWRYVTRDGEVIQDDLDMLRRIDPSDQPRVDIPPSEVLERAWEAAAGDMCRAYNERLDPKVVDAALPASQRWALEMLRSSDLPEDRAYAVADEALGVGRNQLVRRALSTIRKRVAEEALGVRAAADLIVGVVEEFGLRPEPEPVDQPSPIGEQDLGVVCFQVVQGI
ncbi:MAG: helicase-related protein [Actinomycetota bacterium]